MITKTERLKSDLAKFKRLMELARDFNGIGESITFKVGRLEDLAWRLSEDDDGTSFESVVTQMITEKIKELEKHRPMKDDKEAINAKLRPYLTDKELTEFWENREHPENEWIKHGVEMRDAASILSLAFCWEASAQGDVYWYEIYKRIHKAIEEEKKEMPELQQIAAHLRQQIKAPMTLEQIIEEYKQADYSAEMLLQHLLLWVANNQPNEQ